LQIQITAGHCVDRLRNSPPTVVQSWLHFYAIPFQGRLFAEGDSTLLG
jgi:hypothetical protein